MKRLLLLCLPILMTATCVPTARADDTAKTYSARGVVQKIAPSHHQITIHHQAIPGYMMEMTMEFFVKHTNELSNIAPGDEVLFNLVVQGDDDWIQDLHRVGRGALDSSKPITGVGATARALRRGDVLPDDELLTETGRRIRFSEFRGKALAFTFFFTRCPLPDFCPRMNRNFSETRQLILATPGAPENWEFMSISFDPDFDTPTVLHDYASVYRGENSSHWLFACARAVTLSDLAPRLDLMVMRQGGSISHNLRTVVLDTEGRIFRQFDGNEWTARQLADAILEAARIPTTPTQKQSSNIHQ